MISNIYVYLLMVAEKSLQKKICKFCIKIKYPLRGQRGSQRKNDHTFYNEAHIAELRGIARFNRPTRKIVGK